MSTVARGRRGDFAFLGDTGKLLAMGAAMGAAGADVNVENVLQISDNSWAQDECSRNDDRQKRAQDLGVVQ